MTLPLPFADDASSASIDSLIIENGRDKVTLYGRLDITRDKEGLALAREVIRLMTSIVGVLTADPNLPDRVAPPDKRVTVRNPLV